MTDKNTELTIDDLTFQVTPPRGGPAPDRQTARTAAAEWFAETPAGLRELKPGQRPPLEVYAWLTGELHAGLGLAQIRVGDLAASFFRRWPDLARDGTYDALALQVGMNPNTVARWRGVAEAVPEAVRRAGGTYAHWKLLAPLRDDPDGQRAWLEKVEAGGWSYRKLEDELNKSGVETEPERPTYESDRLEELGREVYDRDVKIVELEKRLERLEMAWRVCQDVAIRAEDEAQRIDDYRFKTDPEKEARRLRVLLTSIARDIREAGN